MDVHSKAARSYNMSRIRSKDTAPELLVRRYLHANGFRYTLHNKNLPGKPDIVLPRYKTIVMVHGCFWHGHAGCKYYTVPKTRTEWWINKINNNIANDERSLKALKVLGWKVIHIWTCELKKDTWEKTLQQLVNRLNKAAEN